MQKIGWIGTWVMWNAMVQHLITNQYDVSVYNRTKSKTDNLVELGAKYIDNIAELSTNSDIIISIIWDPKNVEDTYFWNDWILANAKQGSILIDMTTTKPSLAIRIYDEAKQKWISSVDAPVSGWDVWAQSWTLSIMAWWDLDTFTSVSKIFALMWKTITYTWEAWSGQHTKMANQISIAGNTIALCESLVYAEQSGLDLQNTIEVISGWAAWNWGWNNLAQRIVRGELDTCFFVKHFVKDMKIALEECERMNLELPWLRLVSKLYENLIKHWEWDLGTQALIKVIKRMNNISLDS